jgi:Bacterial aa3 type cytochrome c oxidase subunit IV
MGLGYHNSRLSVQTFDIQARRDMAVDTSKGHPAMDYAEHNRTYLGFLRGSVVLIVLVVFILLGMLVALT